MVLLIILAVAGTGLWVGHASWVAKLWHAMITLVVLITAGFTCAALKEIVANPPPPNAEILPKDYKIPYSYYHDDPPDVRLAKELAQRRLQLEAQQRELEQMEQELRDKQDGS